MRSLLAVLVLLSGCDLYFTGDDGDDCQYGYADIAPAQEYRDPSTGFCQSFGYPECNDQCGPCNYDVAMPDWGSCYSKCEGLAEGTCIAESGCFAAYTDFPTQDQAPKFLGCWQTAPSGPIQGGSCQGLDAQTCSRHDDCSAHYLSAIDDASSSFYACTAEIRREPPPACETLATEAACSARGDCEPTYQGDNCTCTPTECVCEVLTYQRCATK